jgi:hypothetical protein
MSSVTPLRRFQLHTIPDGAVIAAIGRRGSGKSLILENVMSEKRHIPDGIGCSGSEESNGGLCKFMPASYVYEDYNPDAIERAVDRARAINRTRQLQGLPKKYTFIIIDDCGCDKAFTNDKTIKRILMNGRHYGIFFVFTMQYPLGVKPDLRTQIDYVFMCYEPIRANRKRLWESYAGVIPTFDDFNYIMDSVCQDYKCLVIAQNKASANLTDCVFHFKANANLPRFRVGSKTYWQAHFESYNPEYDRQENCSIAAGPVTFTKGNRRGKNAKYTTTVQLLD